ncbi:hypothetical protein GA842_07340 [Pediococcus parvulus]|uniref:Phosphoglycerate mutase n=1 Tax=Pediococcus parvulus TaxID=54062 RepID=A0AAP5WE18_9LACO|nr:hypothetical protein [Pediococcus parvulus]
MLINHIGSVLIKKFTVYLIRHGETYLNKFDRMQGWADAPLTPKGIQDAHMAAKKCKMFTLIKLFPVISLELFIRPTSF